MNITRTCDRCGSVVPASAPHNLCLRCLFDSAVDPDPGTSGAEPAASLRAKEQTTPPPVFGDYELLGELGRGGQGVVYRARHRVLGRIVALKTIPPAHLAGAHARERFRLEASTASRLDHPNVVPIYEVGERDGFCFYSMKLVEGATIQQLVSRGVPDAAACRQVAVILVKVAHAVHHAHQRGVLHRDLKPSNVLLDQEHEPHVSDFGLARLTEEDSSLTLSQALIGTPAYLAPEMATGGARQATVAADIYGLGAILYQLVTGRPPFAGATVAETLRAVQEAEPARPRGRNPAVPADLETICLKCLEKEPAKRYGTAQALADDLGRFLKDEAIEARPVGPAAKAWRRCRRKPALASAIVLVLLLLVVVGIGSPIAAYRINQERRKAEAQAYTSDMNVVLQAWEEGNLKRSQGLLHAHIPKAGERDLRGFEWRYLWNLCQDESRYAFTNFEHDVGALAFSPDGKFLAAGAGHVVKLLDITSSRELGEVHDGDTNDAIHCLAFLPTSTNILATAGKLGVIRLWNLTTKETTTFAVHPSEVGSLAFSPDGKMLAVAPHNSGTTLTLWAVEPKRAVWTTNTDIPPNAVAFTPDGKALVSGGGGGNGNARVWEVANGKELAPFPELHKGWLNHIAFSPDGRTLATGAADDRLILWDFGERRPKAPPLSHGGTTMAFSADGRLMASVGFDGLARVWDVASQRPAGLLRGHLGAVSMLAFTPDSAAIVTGGGDRTVRVWDAIGPPEKNTLKAHKQWVHQVAFSPDGKMLASVDYYHGLTKLWDVPSRRFIADLPGYPGDQMAGGAAFSPNGKFLATSSYSGTVMLWDRATLERISVLTNDFWAASLAFSPDSKVLAVATGFVPFRPNIQCSLAFWDWAAKRELNRLAEAAPDAAAVRFSNDGRLVAVGYHYGWLRLWDWQTGRKIAEFQKHDGQVPTVAFSADDTLLASGGQNDEYVVLYSVAPARVLKFLEGHTGGVKSVAFAPDGKTLAAGGNDGMIRLWNLATHQPVLALKKHSGAVTSVAFSRSGSFLASCGADADVRLWPAPSFDEIAQKETENRK